MRESTISMFIMMTTAMTMRLMMTLMLALAHVPHIPKRSKDLSIHAKPGWDTVWFFLAKSFHRG